MSTTLRKGWLKVLRQFGVRSFQATSGLGHQFICHLGDLAGENPFYNLQADYSGLALMTAWCFTETRPVIYDVGANLGFIATQLAQMLRDQQPVIIAFEPVWSTFVKLKHSVRVLKLEKCVMPICCAISDRPGFASIAFDEAKSLFAQLRTDTTNARVGRSSNLVAIQALDAATKLLVSPPTLLKVDVEGFEAHVFRGAQKLLSGEGAPAIMFELNPVTLQEVASSAKAVTEALPNYSFFYVDDFEGQACKMGQRIVDITRLNHVCNLFAVPNRDAARKRWQRCLETVLDRRR